MTSTQKIKLTQEELINKASNLFEKELEESGDESVTGQSYLYMLLPIWAHNLEVHCDWTGEYEEKTVVTRYKKVMKHEDRNKPWEQQRYDSIPYASEESVRKPHNGSIEFSEKVYVSGSKTDIFPNVEGYNPGRLPCYLKPNEVEGSEIEIIPCEESLHSHATKTEIESLCRSNIKRFTRSIIDFTYIYRFIQSDLFYCPVVRIDYDSDFGRRCALYIPEASRLLGELPVNLYAVKNKLTQALSSSRRKWAMTVAGSLFFVVLTAMLLFSHPSSLKIWGSGAVFLIFFFLALLLKNKVIGGFLLNIIGNDLNSVEKVIGNCDCVPREKVLERVLDVLDK